MGANCFAKGASIRCTGILQHARSRPSLATLRSTISSRVRSAEISIFRCLANPPPLDMKFDDLSGLPEILNNTSRGALSRGAGSDLASLRGLGRATQLTVD